MRKIHLISVSVLTCIVFSISATGQHAQRYTNVDQYAINLGALTDKNVAQIADSLGRPFEDKKMKARAYFTWIAHYIALDGKAIRANDQKKTKPEDVVLNRKTTPLGFAQLFQEMCSMGNIRCLVVDGFIKNNTDDIGNPADEPNHSWNVVQLGQSPDEWYYVDVARASGQLDKKMLQFTPNFTSAYFFADRSIFNLDHFPDNKAWQLGDGPKGLKDFYAFPVISYAAYEIGLKKPQPILGMIRTSIKNKVEFSFNYINYSEIKGINLIIGEGSRQLKPEPMNFTDNAGTIRFSYQFKREDTYPVKVEVDGKTVLQYIVEVNE